jgi:HlyD family secretion protein
MKLNRNAVIAAAAVVVIGGGVAGYLFWQQYEASQLPVGIVATNGRVEATQVDISTKIPGRVVEIVPHEGDMVSPEEVVARIDTSETGAQLEQAKAAAALARQTVATREAEVASDDAQLQFANEQMRRTATLVDKGWSTHEQYDQRQQQLKSAGAALNAAKSQIDEARASVRTADAKVAELQAVVNDSTIRSPVQGRVQYRLVEPGAVLPPGGKIATVIDLNDVYTTVFLPAPQAGRLKVGNDPDAARLVMDAYPDYVFPASVSFVAPESQFTPKTVEVQSEREQLYFRVKLQKPPDVLKGMEEQIKSGLRAIAYVRTDPAVEWPAKLAVKLPPNDEQAGK